MPIVFVVDGDRVLTAVDQKPKRSRALRRLDNIRSNPRVAVLADEFNEDWSRLWWARGDGVAEVLDPARPESDRALDLLVDRYSQYRDERPRGPVISISVHRWSGWSAGG